MPQHDSMLGADAYGNTNKASSAQKPRADLTNPEPGNLSKRTPGTHQWYHFKGLSAWGILHAQSVILGATAGP